MLTNMVTLGKTNVECEGNENDNDSYVQIGSCHVRFSIFFLKNYTENTIQLFSCNTIWSTKRTIYI